MFFFTIIQAQKPVDFSGTWVMDLSESDANYKKWYSNVTCVIQQTPQAITTTKTTAGKEGKSSAQEPVVYTLDGKITAKEQYGGVDKYSSAWSPDKKKLILKCVRTMNGVDYGSNESYTLSPDGKVLTVIITDLKGESPITEVFRKK